MDLILTDKKRMELKERPIENMVERNTALYMLLDKLITKGEFQMVRWVGQTLIGAHPSLQQSWLIMCTQHEEHVGRDLIDLLEERMEDALDKELNNQYLEIPITEEMDSWDAVHLIKDVLDAHGTKCSTEDHEEHYVVKYNIHVKEQE